MTVMSPLSCRGLKAISQMPCVRSTAQRGSSCRCVCADSVSGYTWIIECYLHASLSPYPSLSPLYLPIYLTFKPLFFHHHLTQDVKPGFVATAMSGIRKTSRSIPSPITYTRAAVATIGIQHTTYGYFYHALQVGCVLCVHPPPPSVPPLSTLFILPRSPPIS